MMLWKIFSYFLYFIGCGFLCWIFFYIGKFVKQKQMEQLYEETYSDENVLKMVEKVLSSENENTEIENLKNALLSYALNTVKINDPNFKPFSDIRMDYENFDGTSLPMFSGDSLTNACFTYIRDPKEEIYKVIPLLPLETEKQNAIRKYLMKNLNTEQQIIDFFDKFVEISNQNKNVVNLSTEDEIHKFLSTYKDESSKKDE